MIEVFDSLANPPDSSTAPTGTQLVIKNFPVATRQLPHRPPHIHAAQTTGYRLAMIAIRIPHHY